MGLNQGSNILYLNVSCGQFVNKKKELTGYSYTGKIIGIRQEDDTYEEKPISKIKVLFLDAKKQETACIGFGEETWYAHGFFARIGRADLAKPITLGVSKSEQNEKISFCWMKQGQDIIKKDDTFQKPKAVTVGKQSITDWTEVVALERKILEDTKTKLAAIEFGMTPEQMKDLPF